MSTKKDFRPGDKVTIMTERDVYRRGVVLDVHENSVSIIVDDCWTCTAHKSSVYHGHNVKVEVIGEGGRG